MKTKEIINGLLDLRNDISSQLKNVDKLLKEAKDLDKEERKSRLNNGVSDVQG